MTAIRVRPSTICLIVLSTALMLFQERGARRPANGNNWIGPLADLETDLKGKLEGIKIHGKSGDPNGQVRLNFETKVLPLFSGRLSFGER